MLETHIKILATIYTAILMAVISYVLIFGGFDIKSPTVKGKVISATMVDISQIKSLNKPTKKQTVKKSPPIKEAPKKEPPKKKEEIKPVKPVIKEPPKKDPPRIVKKEPKVDTKAVELERKKQQEFKKRKEELQKKKIASEKRRKQAEQDLKELANKAKESEQAQPQTNIGNEKGTSEADEKMRLMMQYQLAVISKVKWVKPVSANDNLLCIVKVRQIPGGGVIDATISSPCNANTIVQQSIIAAIKKADPLPYKGFESVFDREAEFTFKQSKE